MAKFNKYDFVKFTEEAVKEFGFDNGSFVITDVSKNEDGEYVYELYRQQMFSEQEIRSLVNEDWLKPAKSPKEVLDSALNGIKLPTLPPLCVSEEQSNHCNLEVSILGTTYTIQELSVSEDISLKDCDGYCDRTDKRIVVAKKEADCDLGDFEQHRKKTMRHEVLHAFFNESGLAENFENKRYGIPETLVDWFAIQSPKIYKTFTELDIL